MRLPRFAMVRMSVRGNSGTLSPLAAGLLVAAPVQGDVWETMLYLFGRDAGWPA